MKDRVEQLSRNLKRVHKIMLDRERVAAEIRMGRRLTPLDFFNLLTRDPEFSWLMPISALMAEIDEFVDESTKESRPVTQVEFDTIRTRVESVLLGSNSVTPQKSAVVSEVSLEGTIAERYREHLARDPELVIAHADLRADLGPLKRKNDP